MPGQAAKTVYVVSVNTGKQFPQTAKNSFTAWTTYDIDGFTVGGGAFYTSRVFGGYSDNRTATQNAAGVVTINPATTILARSIPSYWRFDARAAYKFSKNIQLSVNAAEPDQQALFQSGLCQPLCLGRGRPHRVRHAQLHLLTMSRKAAIDDLNALDAPELARRLSGRREDVFAFVAQVADAGSAEAQARLGQMLLDGDGATADAAQGVAWFEHRRACRTSGGRQYGRPLLRLGLGRRCRQDTRCGLVQAGCRTRPDLGQI